MSNNASLPPVIEQALAALDPGWDLTAFENVSMTVSTNQVYRLRNRNGQELFAKLSSHGSYVHFREDHQLIHQWVKHLRHTRYEDFLAKVADQNGQPFTFKTGHTWVAFYHKVPFYDFLPKRLSDIQVESLGRELAHFHLESTRIASYMDGSWKSTGSDIGRLYDLLGTPEFQQRQGIGSEQAGECQAHCDQFLFRAGELGYHHMKHIPVLVDWNITNFSVGLDSSDAERSGFKFFSRWDYDWFRLEPRVMDFYFCARVVRDAGDEEVFSYSADPFFEPRFARFLKAYHEVFPLTEEELSYAGEAYRFFLLNYVMRDGQHFFRPEICRRLQQEALHDHLPNFNADRFTSLLRVIK